MLRIKNDEGNTIAEMSSMLGLTDIKKIIMESIHENQAGLRIVIEVDEDGEVAADLEQKKRTMKKIIGRIVPCNSKGDSSMHFHVRGSNIVIGDVTHTCETIINNNMAN